MEGFYHSVSAVLVLIILMLVGYFMSWRGWMGPDEKRFLGKFIFNIAIPCNCLSGVLDRLEREMLEEAVGLLALAAVLMAGTVLLSMAAATALHLPRNRWGVFVAMGGMSNCLFVGLPMGREIFGDICIPYIMVYYLVNALYIQTIGISVIQWSGTGIGTSKRGIWPFIKQLLSKPPVLTIFASVAMLLAGIRPPEVIMSVSGYISSSVAPLALIYIGYVVYELGLKNLRLERGLSTMLVIRLAIAPAMCLLLCSLMGVEGLARDVFAMESALPVISQAPVLAGNFGADDHYAAIGSCLSTLACFITMPVLMLFL
ncbi:MAG: AEC family transporter [Lawsonibacter sp.]